MRNSIYIVFITLAIVFMSGCSSNNSKETGEYTEGEIVKDIDGNEYKTIKIGDQVWMAENLKVTKYNNGDKINMPPKGSEYSLENGPVEFDKAKGWYYDFWETKDACLNYFNDEKQRFNTSEDGPDSRGKYGLLYNCKAVVDPRGLAPKGYHIPSKEEFETLIKSLGGYEGTTFSELTQFWDGAVGTKLISEKDWQIDRNHNQGTNESGFNALPAGYKSGGAMPFGGIGEVTSLWSSTVSPEPLEGSLESRSDNWHVTLTNHHLDGVELSYLGIGHGYSIRCIKDYPGMIVNKTVGPTKKADISESSENNKIDSNAKQTSVEKTPSAPTLENW